MSGQSAPECVRVSGPLAKFADGFRVDLLERGYSRSGAHGQLYLLAHVSRWMEAEGLEPAVVDRGDAGAVFRLATRSGVSQEPLAVEPADAAGLLGWAERAAARRRRRLAG